MRFGLVVGVRVKGLGVGLRVKGRGGVRVRVSSWGRVRV